MAESEHQEHEVRADTSARSDSDSGASDADQPPISELLGDVVDLAQRGARAWEEVREDWEDRARSDRPWTTDSIMNEVVNSWERVTPLMGEAIDAGIAGFTWGLQNYWPSADTDLAALQASVDAGSAGEAAAPYLEIPRNAVDRMLAVDYQSADAVEHWARWYGMAMKDVWRMTAEARDRSEPTEQDAEGS